MDSAIQFLEQLRDWFLEAAIIFVDLINYILFIGAVLLLVTAIITDRKGENLGFNAGRWALICGIAGAGITLARNVFGV